MPPSSRRKSEPALRSSCPIAGTLDLIGDRWTLLVIRDLFRGKSRYGEFAESPEGIPTNILADRLERLAEAGLVESAPYQERPVRHAYKLTKKGESLKPVLMAIGQWGKENIPGTSVSASMRAAFAGP